MKTYCVTFTECAEIEADNEEHAIRLARENVHVYAEDDAYYKVEEIKRMKVSRIGFFDDQIYGGRDETEFDTWDENELAQLWWEFCKENDLIWVTKHEVKEDD